MIPVLNLKARTWYPGSVTAGLVKTPSQILITEEVNKHTLFQTRHEGGAKYLRETLRSGAPMVVDISTAKDTHRWHGYVDSLLEKQDSESGTTFTDVVGVGVTYPMKEADVQTNAMLVEAQRTLIKRSGLVPLVRGPLSMKPIVAGGRSMWTTLVAAACEFHQYVFCTGTTLNVLQVQDIIDLYVDEAPTLVYRAADEMALTRFEAPSTDNVAPRQIGFAVEPRSAAVRQTTTAEGMFTSYPNVVSGGIDASSQLDTDPIIQHAVAEGGGNVNVHAGKLVYIKNVEPGAWWLVLKVVHDFRIAGAYRMTLKLARTRSIEKITKVADKPTRNLARVGDYLERVNLENSPVLETGATFVHGTSSWRNPPVWRPQC